jgi:hypothetical protein
MRRWKAKATSDLGDGFNKSTIAFFQHHKCGTDLSRNIARSMSSELGMPFHNVKWMDISHDSTLARCIPGSVMLYEDMRVHVLEEILKDCPDLRAVHFTRNLADEVVSNYVYTKNLHLTDELISDRIWMVTFRFANLSDGLSMACGRDRRNYIPQMVATYQAVQDQELENILSVRYENWMGHFDNVTMSILEHFLGKGHSKIDSIFELAKAEDTSTWSDEKVASHRHVSDTEEKAEAAQRLVEMYSEGDECARSLEVYNHQLGYYDWPPAS